MRAGQAPGFLTVQGLSLRVAVEGRGQPLLLISGLGASLDVWEPLREILPGFQTIAFDIPGVGESPFPSWPLTIPRLARLTAGVVETLGYDRVDVMGVSWGGGLAQELAHRAPDRVRRLVLVAKGTRMHHRQTIFNVQGFVGSTMVFHADVLGVPLKMGGSASSSAARAGAKEK